MLALFDVLVILETFKCKFWLMVAVLNRSYNLELQSSTSYQLNMSLILVSRLEMARSWKLKDGLGS